MYIKTSKMRKELIAISQNLKTTFNIGKNEMDENFIKAIEENLNANEIIKIHILNNSDVDKVEVSNFLAKKTKSEVVAVIGKRIILYKPNSDKEKRKIIL